MIIERLSRKCQGLSSLHSCLLKFVKNRYYLSQQNDMASPSTILNELANSVAGPHIMMVHGGGGADNFIASSKEG